MLARARRNSGGWTRGACSAGGDRQASFVTPVLRRASRPRTVRLNVAQRAVFVALTVASCASPRDTPDVIDAPARAPRTYDFVVSDLTVDPTDDPATPHTGLDLDGLCSGPDDPSGCNHADFLSADDDDQNSMTDRLVPTGAGCHAGAPGCRGCIDNQLPTIINSVQAAVMNQDLRAILRHQVRSGQVTLLLRVTGVDDLRDDDAVEVLVVAGYPMVADCDRQFDGDGEFAVRTQSLRTGNIDITSGAIVRMPGRIDRGRLGAGPAAWSLTLPFPEIMGIPPPFVLGAPRLRATLATDGNRAAAGVLAGVADANVLADIQRMQSCGHAFDNCELGSGIVDIPIPSSALCVDRSDPNHWRYGSIGLAVGMTLVRAVISPTPRTERAPGMCGSPRVGDGGSG